MNSTMNTHILYTVAMRHASLCNTTRCAQPRLTLQGWSLVRRSRSAVDKIPSYHADVLRSASSDGGKRRVWVVPAR